MKWFEIKTPDGRILRHQYESIEWAKDLLPGYTVVGEIIGVDENGEGGFSEAALEGILEWILNGRAAVLRKWLSDNGYEPKKAAK